VSLSLYRHARIRTYLFLALTVFLAGLAGWSFLIEPDLLLVRKVDIESRNWPRGMPRLRVAVLSDLHVGAPHIDLAKLDEIVARVNALDPDLVLLLGDFVIGGVLFGRYTAPDAIAARLKSLRARHGVFAVLGNHDWWDGGPRMMAALRRAGITVLENQVHRLSLPRGPVWLAGLADDLTRTPRPAATVARVPAGAPIIAFAHQPVTFLDLPGRVAVMFAGHSHGGQVWLPLIGPPILPGRAPRRFAYGLIRERGSILYVTGGVGTSIIPVRFNMPPEIVLATVGRAT
jgi:predicted MPP superfamily phosphohydrolase